MHERRHEPCSNFLTGRSAQNSQGFHACWVFALYFLKKKAQIICASDSAAECTASDSLDPSSSPSIAEQLSFCWNGFCARDCFKHSEAKWRQLPWLRSETLFPGCRLALQCTKVERSSRYLDERSFATLPPFQWTAESTEQGHCKWVCNSIVNGHQ